MIVRAYDCQGIGQCADKIARGHYAHRLTAREWME
jgi:hypothetical protein